MALFLSARVHTLHTSNEPMDLVAASNAKMRYIKYSFVHRLNAFL